MGPRSLKRRFWGRLGAWWRRKRNINYLVVADAWTDPAAEATRGLMLPSSSSTETPEEAIFEVTPEVETILPEAPQPLPGAALLPPEEAFKARPILLQAVAVVSPTPLPPRAPVLEKLPPLVPKKIPFLPVPLTKQSSLSSMPDPFVRRRTKDSFQGSLESIDSLIDSYWDPDENASLATPVAANIAQSLDFLEEHVDFLKVQTQPRSVEVVWETEVTLDADEFSF